MDMAVESPYYNYVPTRGVAVIVLGLFTASTRKSWFDYEIHEL
jgi:hypothetical protein